MTNLFLAWHIIFLPETQFLLRPHDQTESGEKLSSDRRFVLSIFGLPVRCLESSFVQKHFPKNRENLIHVSRNNLYYASLLVSVYGQQGSASLTRNIKMPNFLN